MGFTSTFQSGAVTLYDTGGEDAVFTPASGSPVSCKIFFKPKVIFGPIGLETSGREPGTSEWEQGTQIEALLSVIGKEPAEGDSFNYDEKTYDVLQAFYNDGIEIKCLVVEQ